MKNNRRNFLKLAGISAAGATILPGCDAGTAADGKSTVTKDWVTDPEWQKVKYGTWSGPGVPDGPGPMDSVLLKDYAPRSSVVGQQTFLPKARYAPIDVHVHNYPERAEGKTTEMALADWVNTQREAGIGTSVVLTGATGDDFDKLVEMYLAAFPEQFQLYCGLEQTGIDKPDYPERAVAELERCYKKGARGVGELSDKGFGLTRDKNLAPDKRLHADDPRLDPFWKKCAELKTLCDTDELLFDKRAKTVFDKTGVKPLAEWDMQKVLEDKEIDIVSLATPNHWHALGTIWACQAGKHVYVEKPAMHDMLEGRKMIEVARKYNRRVQVGFQSRSNVSIIDAIKFLHEGGIGEVYAARGLCIKPRDSFGIAKDSLPPSTFHYDRWLGPAAYRPYNEKRSHYNWHWFWDTGNGDTGNQGPHQFDIARWGMNKNVHPISVYSTGGIYGIDPEECAQQTPNTQISVFKYQDGKMLEFETRGRYSNGESSLDTRIGNIFYGTDGYLELNDGTWKAFRKREKEPFAASKRQKQEEESLTGSSGSEHFVNLLDAVRTGKNETLHCDINEGFYSSALPLLANISYRLGRELKFMGEYEKFVNDAGADTMLSTNHRPPYNLPEKI